MSDFELSQMTKATLWSIAHEPTFNGVSPVVKSLILTVAHRLCAEICTEILKETESQTKRIIEERRSTPQEQAEAIGRQALATLYTSEAEELIRDIASKYIEEITCPQAHPNCGINTDDQELAYHSASEVRELIKKNLTTIRDYFGEREVPFSALCDHVQRYTILRPGDKVRGRNSAKRWNQQVGNAIRSSAWPDCPIAPTDIRSVYKIKPE